jgi:ribosomal protein L7/L12
MGDVLIIMLPALILAAVLWAVSAALKPRNFGISDAERYQLELAMRSRAHYEAQVKAAMAARARVDAATRPSQNEQQQSQQAEHARAGRGTPAGASGSSFSDAGRPGYLGAVLPGGQLSPQFSFQLQALARSGHKVQAIKLLRQATHADLLTAKNYVDRL